MSKLTWLEVAFALVAWVLSLFNVAEMIRLLLIVIIAVCTLISFISAIGNIGDGGGESLISFVVGCVSLCVALGTMPSQKIIDTLITFVVGFCIVGVVIWVINDGRGI